MCIRDSPHVFRDPVRPSRCGHDADELCRAGVRCPVRCPVARSRIVYSPARGPVFAGEPGEALCFALGWAVGVALLVAYRVGEVGARDALFTGRHGNHGRDILRAVTRRVVYKGMYPSWVEWDCCEGSAVIGDPACPVSYTHLTLPTTF